jgi:large subunit ribosomal protein L13
MQKTYSAKPTDVTRIWYVIDASTAPMGKVATAAAKLLIGKDKTMFTRHIDTGDSVVIINAGQLVVSGNKTEQKTYHKHSGYPGNLHTRTLKQQIEKDASKALEHAIRGMLPINKLRDPRLARLKIYNTDVHNHEAQKPVKVEVK